MKLRNGRVILEGSEPTTLGVTGNSLDPAELYVAWHAALCDAIAAAALEAETGERPLLSDATPIFIPGLYIWVPAVKAPDPAVAERTLQEMGPFVRAMDWETIRTDETDTGA